MEKSEISNEMASGHWNHKPVGHERSKEKPGENTYHEDIRQYRYGYETPFIVRLFGLNNLENKKVLEIGVGNGIDAGEIVKGGGTYTGLDITPKHIELTTQYLQKILNRKEISPHRLIAGDLLEQEMQKEFDVVYSFGVLHHIEHEELYLKKINQLLKDNGTLRIALYAKFSFFSFYMYFTWVVKNRCKVPLKTWQSYLAENTDLDKPVTIKVRNRMEIENILNRAGFRIIRYQKRGFVQNYIPYFGRYLSPDGNALNFLGSILGWYHILWCEKSKKS